MSTYALGIMVSGESLHAVLVERTEDESVVQFKTSSSELKDEDAGLPFEDDQGAAPGMEEEPDDVTIQFGDDGGGDDLFMGSEFDELENEHDELGGNGNGTGHWTFQAELDELLDLCAEHGYEDPEIAFCSSTAEIDELELRLPDDQSQERSEEERGLPLPASRSTLMDMLEEQYEGGVEDERVGFIPMQPSAEGRDRVLALIARPGGPVLSTLSTMQEQTLARSPRAQLLDSEVSLYMGLARSVLQLPPDTPEKTILVRSSPQDTLVLFIEGNTLREFEHLPELTSEDTAETICSRVLLLQDEYGMGEVQHVMLIAQGNERKLADAFKSYFASANLRLLRSHLPNGEESESEAFVAATGAALRLLGDPDYDSFFQPINLLPKSYTASRFRLPVGWSVPFLLALLAATTLGFVWYYFVNARAISQQRSRLQTLEAQIENVDQEALERRIDSLQSATAQYAEGRQVLDRLLKGSNKWSKGLASVTERVRDIDGLSLAQWSPVDSATVQVNGRSTARLRVVRLARDLNGEINRLTFTEVRDVPLYDFEITVPLDTTKPEGVDYWRERRVEQLAASADGSRASGATASSLAPADTVGRAADAVASSSSTETQSATAAQQPSQSGAWTVVVASLAERGPAQEVARAYRERLSETNYTVQIRHSPENGRYRVGVGQFASAGDAESALRTIEELLPSDAWLTPSSDSAQTGSSVAGPGTNADTAAVDASMASTDMQQTTGAANWTVVIASLAQREDADEVARVYRNRLGDSDYEVWIDHGPGDERHRVGIGRFSSFEGAREALRALGDAVPSDAWLHRFRESTGSAAETTAANSESTAG